MTETCPCLNDRKIFESIKDKFNDRILGGYQVPVHWNFILKKRKATVIKNEHLPSSENYYF